MADDTVRNEEQTDAASAVTQVAPERAYVTLSRVKPQIFVPTTWGFPILIHRPLSGCGRVIRGSLVPICRSAIWSAGHCDPVCVEYHRCYARSYELSRVDGNQMHDAVCAGVSGSSVEGGAGSRAGPAAVVVGGRALTWLAA